MAASTADAPGMGTTRPPSAAQAATQRLAGVGHARGAGVGHERQVRAAAEVADQLDEPGGDAPGVERGQPSLDAVAGEEPPGEPGVLGGYERHGVQDLDRPHRDIGQVADRGSDDVQRPAPRRLVRHVRAEPGRRRGYR